VRMTSTLTRQTSDFS